MISGFFFPTSFVEVAKEERRASEAAGRSWGGGAIIKGRREGLKRAFRDSWEGLRGAARIASEAAARASKAPWRASEVVGRDLGGSWGRND